MWSLLNELHNNVVYFELRNDTCVLFPVSVLIRFPNALNNRFIDLAYFNVCPWPPIKQHRYCTM